MKVFIIEDVEEMRILLEDALKVDFEVMGSAPSIMEARSAFFKDLPQVLLLDEILPGESSVDFLQEMFESRIGVVLMTRVENPKHAIPDGALGRIQKPGFRNLSHDLKRFCDEVRIILQKVQS